MLWLIQKITLEMFLIIHLLEIMRAELTDEQRTEINDGIARLLTKLDKAEPGIRVTQDTRPFAATMIATKWIQYFKPGPEYFSVNTNHEGYTYEEMETQLDEALKTMESANPAVVDHYANTLVVYANSADRVRFIDQYDSKIMQAVEEMLLQSYIARKKLSVKPGETIEITGDLFLKLKNPSMSEKDIKERLTRTFKAPPKDTLTILQSA